VSCLLLNVGDTFLPSWAFDEEHGTAGDSFTSKNCQTEDKALSVGCSDLQGTQIGRIVPWSSVRCGSRRSCDKAKGAKMGCGIHTGTAVQGAIGSQRKIDATFVSEAVERSEFVESSTKKYGLKMLKVFTSF
jgi:class 3 adenylate cyclase